MGKMFPRMIKARHHKEETDGLDNIKLNTEIQH